MFGLLVTGKVVEVLFLPLVHVLADHTSSHFSQNIGVGQENRKFCFSKFMIIFKLDVVIQSFVS